MVLRLKSLSITAFCCKFLRDKESSRAHHRAITNQFSINVCGMIAIFLQRVLTQSIFERDSHNHVSRLNDSIEISYIFVDS